MAILDPQASSIGGGSSVAKSKASFGGKKSLADKALKRETMTQSDWEAKFEELLEEDLVEIPDELLAEPLYYDDPNELNNIFTGLEEENLFLIHRSQDVELNLEDLQHKFALS